MIPPIITIAISFAFIVLCVFEIILLNHKVKIKEIQREIIALQDSISKTAVILENHQKAMEGINREYSIIIAKLNERKRRYNKRNNREDADERRNEYNPNPSTGD